LFGHPAAPGGTFSQRVLSAVDEARIIISEQVVCMRYDSLEELGSLPPGCFLQKRYTRHISARQLTYRKKQYFLVWNAALLKNCRRSLKTKLES
jgi:hypothetical protein